MKNHIAYFLIITFIFSNKILGQPGAIQPGAIQPGAINVNELIQKGQYLQAITTLEKLNTGDSTQSDILQKQAFCNLKLGRIGQARKLYQAVLLRNPESIENLLQLAIVSEKEYKLLEAFKSFQQLNCLDTLNTFYWKELARISVRMERPKYAILYLKKAISIDNNDIESLASLANLYLNKGDINLADPLIDAAFRLDSSAINIRHLRSRMSYTLSDFKAVRKDILFTMSLGDSTTYYQKFLGTAYYYLDSLDKSIATFKRLVSINEKTEYVYAGLAFAHLKLAKERGDEDSYSAFTNFSEAIDLGTSNRLSDYKMGLADLNVKIGSIDFAIQQFSILKENRPKALFRLGEIYDEKKNDKAMAVIYFQEYINKCAKMTKPTSDCNFVGLAKDRLNALNSTSKVEFQQIVIAKDSLGMLVDTVKDKDK